jgi:hypothetical protein
MIFFLHFKDLFQLLWWFTAKTERGNKKWAYVYLQCMAGTIYDIQQPLKPSSFSLWLQSTLPHTLSNHIVLLWIFDLYSLKYSISQEHIGPLILEKLQTFILTRINLLYPLCYEIPCTRGLSRGMYMLTCFFLLKEKLRVIILSI